MKYIFAILMTITLAACSRNPDYKVVENFLAQEDTYESISILDVNVVSVSPTTKMYCGYMKARYSDEFIDTVKRMGAMAPYARERMRITRFNFKFAFTVDSIGVVTRIDHPANMDWGHEITPDSRLKIDMAPVNMCFNGILTKP